MTDADLTAAKLLFSEPAKCRECLGLNGTLCRNCGGTGLSPKNAAGLALLAENARLRARVAELDHKLSACGPSCPVHGAEASGPLPPEENDDFPVNRKLARAARHWRDDQEDSPDEDDL